MKRLLWLLLAVVLCTGIGPVQALDAVKPAPAAPAAAGATKPPPGVEAAQALSTITGVAISPLLGVSAVGAWKYFKTPAAARANLPWFAQPWFWIPGLLLVALVFAKDTLGTAAPTALKKPFDVAELFENKVSALIAAGLFVPFMVSIFGSTPEGASLAKEMGLAAIDGAAVLNALLVPFGIAAFLVVWMLSHVINILILISPFGTVDAALKAARMFLLTTVAGSALVNPWLGAVVALAFILVSCLLAGWSMRLTVFGTVFAWDLFTLRHKRSEPVREKSRVFLARSLGKIPVRTCGLLRRDEQGRLVMDYRPWLVLPRRTLVLPEGDYYVGRGLVYPEVLHLKDGVARTLLTLPPRFLGHEEAFARAHGLAGIQDVGMVKGFKALWNWMKGWWTPLPKPAAA